MVNTEKIKTLTYLINAVIRRGRTTPVAQEALQMFNSLFLPRGVLGVDTKGFLNLLILNTRDTNSSLPSAVLHACDHVVKWDGYKKTCTILKDRSGHYKRGDIINTDGKLVGLVITGVCCDIF